TFVLAHATGMVTGCASRRAMVRLPYDDVRQGMIRMARHINAPANDQPYSREFSTVNPYGSQTWRFPSARTAESKTGRGYELHIEEIMPGSVVSLHTTINAQPAKNGWTRITIVSKKTGIWFDSRQRGLEKSRLSELLSTLPISY